LQLVVDVRGALFRAIVALLAGMLIGLEREKARAMAEKRRRGRVSGFEDIVAKEIPGLRTFSLISLYAALSGYAYSSGLVGTTVLLVLVSGFLLVLVVYTIYRLMVGRIGGVTTVVVMLVDFIIGFLAGLGEVLVATSVAILTTFVLAVKLPAEKLVGRIRYEELLWFLELAVILAVIGPFFLMSNYRVLGISVRGIYLFFALVLTSSYLGYIAVRVKGAEGIAYFAFLGGFANSEATTMAGLRLLGRSEAERLAPYIALTANGSMLLRNLAITLVAFYLLVGEIPFPQSLALVVGVAGAVLPSYLSWKRLKGHASRIELPEIENPLSFSIAFKSTLVYVALALVASLVSLAGSLGLAVFSLLGGFVNASATILSLFSVGEGAVLLTFALLALAAASMNKTIYVYIATLSRRAAAKTLAACIVQSAILAAAAAAALRLLPPL